MKTVGVAPGARIARAKRLPAGKAWRVVTPGKRSARRAILMSKFTIDGKTLAVFHILPGERK